MVRRASGITVPQMYGSQLPASTKLYAAPVTAAPGIDLREFGVALIYAVDVLRSVGGANTIVANKIDLLIDLIDASPKGALNEQFGSAEGLAIHRRGIRHFRQYETGNN